MSLDIPHRFISDSFFRILAHQGTIRRELFCDIAVSELFFHYVPTKSAHYRLTDDTLIVDGTIEFYTDINILLPLLLLHMNGSDGECICCINPSQINPAKVQIDNAVLEDRIGAEYRKYQVRFLNAEVHLFAFVLKKYVPLAWNRFIETITQAVTKI